MGLDTMKDFAHKKAATSALRRLAPNGQSNEMGMTQNLRTLRHTILWISNGGRHYPPWSGRHTAVMGLEDTTSYFHYGLAESAKSNPLNRRGIPTAVRLNPKTPTVVNYIFGVAEIPAGFDRVKDLRARSGGIELLSASGRRAWTANKDASTISVVDLGVGGKDALRGEREPVELDLLRVVQRDRLGGAVGVLGVGA